MFFEGEIDDLQAVIHIGSTSVFTVVGRFEGTGDQSYLNIMTLGRAHTDAFMRGQIGDRKHLLSAIHKSLQEALDISNIKPVNPIISFASPLMQSSNQIHRVQIADPDNIVTADDVCQAYYDIDNQLEQQEHACLQKCQQLVFLDNNQQEVRDAIGLRAKQIDVACHVMSVPQSFHQQLLDLLHDQDIRSGAMVFDGVAGATYALTEHEKQQGVCFVDIGATMTKVCVYDRGVLIFSDCLDVGGHTVDLDIAKECGISILGAEGFKRNQGTLDPSKYSPAEHVIYAQHSKHEKTMLRRELNQVIEARYYDIFASVFAKLSQAQVPSIDAGLVLAGGGSQMDGLVGFIQTKFGVPARLIDINPRIKLDPRHLSDDNIILLKKHLKDNTLHSAIGALLYAGSEQFARDQKLLASQVQSPLSLWWQKCRAFLEKLKSFS